MNKIYRSSLALFAEVLILLSLKHLPWLVGEEISVGCMWAVKGGSSKGHCDPRVLQENSFRAFRKLEMGDIISTT